MQRRSFLKNAACIGACATMLAPVERLLAASRSNAYALTLLKLDEARGCVNAASCTPFIGDVRIRTSGAWTAASMQQVVMRVWFASDSGSRAFDFASAGANGKSSEFRFLARAERLASLEAKSVSKSDTRGPSSAQYITTSRDGGYLAPGRFWLVLHSDKVVVSRHDQSEVLARVHLHVTEATA